MTEEQPKACRSGRCPPRPQNQAKRQLVESLERIGGHNDGFGVVKLLIARSDVSSTYLVYSSGRDCWHLTGMPVMGMRGPPQSTVALPCKPATLAEVQLLMKALSGEFAALSQVDDKPNCPPSCPANE